MSCKDFVQRGIDLPGNSQYVQGFDTTRLGLYKFTASANAPSTPGPLRAFCAGARGYGHLKVGDQAVTIKRYIIDDEDAYQEAFSQAVAAGDTFQFDWKFEQSEIGIYVLAGGTAPNDLDFQITVTWDRS